MCERFRPEAIEKASQMWESNMAKMKPYEVRTPLGLDIDAEELSQDDVSLAGSQKKHVVFAEGGGLEDQERAQDQAPAQGMQQADPLNYDALAEDLEVQDEIAET